MLTPTPDSKRLGKRIRVARHVAGLSLDEVSLRTGLNKGHLSRIEHGVIVNLPVSTLKRIAKAIRILPMALMDDRAA